MSAFGLTAEDLAPAAVELWPENEAAVLAFAQMSTQWRVGMGGPVGLDYAPLPFVLRMSGIPRGDWSDVFESVRLMENAALKAMSEG